MRKGKDLLLIAGYASPLIMVCLALFVGRYPISFVQVLSSLLYPFLPGIAPFAPGTPELSLAAYTLVVNVRLPRAIGAAIVGAALAASGAAFQGVFRNPLVSSGILGVTNGAGFGAAVAIVFFSAVGAAIYPFAFVFGIIAVLSSYLIARVYRSTPTIMLILGGTIVSSVFSALISLMKFIADPSTQLPNLVYWLMGSMASVGWEQLLAAIPIFLGFCLLCVMSWRINVLSMGDKEARAMGVDVVRDKVLVIAGATLASAGAVCISGVVGWVGLIIPHIGRMLVGSDNRRLIPLSACIGGAFLVLIDLACRSLTISEIPLGVLTALIGAPFFVYLLKKTKGRDW
ncbi:MAG: iron ABC transporter permease [Coriobacteriales bacterium]|nr:iron ABC transporter permease [Coriobacteriales bacterium]